VGDGTRRLLTLLGGGPHPWGGVLPHPTLRAGPPPARRPFGTACGAAARAAAIDGRTGAGGTLPPPHPLPPPWRQRAPTPATHTGDAGGAGGGRSVGQHGAQSPPAARRCGRVGARGGVDSDAVAARLPPRPARCAGAPVWGTRAAAGGRPRMRAGGRRRAAAGWRLPT